MQLGVSCVRQAVRSSRNQVGTVQVAGLGVAGVSDAEGVVACAALKVAMLMPCAGAMQGRPSGSLHLCKLKQKRERPASLAWQS